MAVLGDAIGVEPKWKSPLHAAHAESLGLCLQGLTTFTAKLPGRLVCNNARLETLVEATLWLI